MGKNIKLSYLIYFIAGFSILLLVISAYKVERYHEKKLYLVINNKIKEAAKECYLKSDCEGKVILKDLYKKKYLDEIVDPVTKEVMDENTCLNYIDKKVEFCK